MTLRVKNGTLCDGDFIVEIMKVIGKSPEMTLQ